jgi:excinuclease UvrABC nuclease subunit
MPISGDRYKFSSENVDIAPNDEGVYELYDGDELIYVGRAAGLYVTIRTRLQSHLRGDEGRCTQRATAYRREVTNTPTAREKELLLEYRRLNGRLPRCNDRVG